MIKLEGFDLKDELYNGASTVIYRAIDIKNSRNVVVKVLKSEYPTPDEIKKFSYEYEIAKKLNVEGVIKNYEMIEYKNTRAIIMEDCGGVSLDKMAGGNVGKKIGIKNFLILALKIVDILGKVHANKIIHKDIKPHNILINAGTGDIRLIDFSISSQLSKEQQELKAPEDLEGTLSYISPEQTGRMNRSVDYRTDFYSLGVTFYELITGKVPFESNDPMELVHCHIAKTPVRPDVISNEIPAVISDIVMKMMSKQAEQRYQSAFGLKKDLEKSYKLLKETGSIEPFEIGSNDISDRFQIPEKLYGRENEMNILMSKFDSASKGKKEIILFTGNPGIGKSAIINEMHKPVSANGGFFIEGKFDQLKKNIPYSAIIEAFQSMIRQIITESDDSVEIWKNKILKATGNNAQVIIQVIPELEMITGEQPEVQTLPPAESQNRFNMVFQNFTRALADKDHPLVLFIDDFQWADSASLNLIYTILTDIELGYFMFIGSYRDSDVDAVHQLNGIIEKIKKDGVFIESIKIDPLKKDAVNMLLSETLSTSSGKTASLADIVMSKSGGNPFFINEFVRTLHDQGLINFNEGWKWDITGIQSAGITDNVVELMTKKIKKLPENTMNILKTASCIGSSFDLPLLSHVTGQSEHEIFDLLKEAVNEGMIIKVDRIFKFVHDRVREAAYGLSDENGKADLHYKIAKVLLQKYNAENSTEEDLFTLVGHLNKAVTILNTDEKKNLLLLNLDAGRKAKANAAFEAAAGYITNSITFLNEKSWTENYQITLEIFINKAELEYINSNFDESDKYFDLIMNKSMSIFDKVKIYELRSKRYQSISKYNEALDLIIEALNMLNYKLPKNPSPLHVIIEVMSLKFGLGKKQPIDLFSENEIVNERVQTIIRLLDSIILISYVAKPNLMPIVVFRISSIVNKYGNSEYSLYGLAFTSLLYCAVLGDTKTGMSFSELCIKLANKYTNKFYTNKPILANGIFINHYKYPIKESLESIKQGYDYSISAGDKQYASYALVHECNNNFLMGCNLSELNDLYNKYYPIVLKLKITDSINYFEPYRKLVEKLLSNEYNDFYIFGKTKEEEDSMIINFFNLKDFSLLAFIFISKLIISNLFEKGEEANYFFNQGEKAIGSLLGQISSIDFWFYGAMAITSIYLNKNKKEKAKLLKKLYLIEKKFQKWGVESPANYGHKYILIKAELARLNDSDSAMKLYDDSVVTAKENGFTHIEAIANECAAKYYLSKGLKRIAGAYMIEARYCYEKWGAKAKVNQLNEKYSELLQGMGHATADTGSLSSVTASTSGRTTSRSGGTGALDIGTVMKASQALAGEIEMSRLLDRMIRILTENAGAQKGAFLLISEKGEMTIEAESFEDRDTVDVLKSIALDTAKTLSPAIVRYVARTKEAIVLNDASAEGTFTKDEYVVNKKPKSVLCVPITNQGKLIGVLYMENNLSAGAFTPARVETLKVLSAQAAISIENARLILEMEDKARLQQEMEIAEHIQTSLCPPAPEHNELEIAAVMRPAEEVGGDYYDIVNDRNGDLWMAIGDVSGHGVTPGLIMMMAQTSFNTALDQSARITPADAIVSVNDILTSNVRMKLKEGHFMTMTFLKYQGKGKFQYAGAHLDIMVYRASSGKCEEFKTDGLFLALKKDIRSVTMDKEIELSKDDVMVVYTDGVIESRKAGNRDELWDSDNLIQVIESNGKKSCEEIKNAIVKGALDWCAGKPDDDITVVVVKMK